MLTLEKIKEMHGKAYSANQTTREKAADDLIFYWVTQWDDTILDDSQLLYKGEFNIIRKAGRQIMSDLALNPIQVDFEPVDDDRDDAAEFLDGIYRAVDRKNTSQEAYGNASSEAVVCGVGAWKLITKYVTNRAGDERQEIVRTPIYEANNVVFWDPAAKLLDKSDAKYCSVLCAYSEDGYRELLEGLGKEGLAESSFGTPETSYTFPWVTNEKTIYVAEFYHVEIVNDVVLTFRDLFGRTVEYSKLEVDGREDELMDNGYDLVGERKIKRQIVTRYLVSGADILEVTRIPGKFIPVIPAYGERAFVENGETYEGITRLAKDPQRLRNFQMSYLADVVSRGPRAKPIFHKEQIAGLEFMYQVTGADNNYPYMLQNRFDVNGNPLPVGPVGMMPDTPIPQALAASIALSREAVEDVANPGVPQDIADPDLSGKAVAALQNRIDNQSYIYQHNLKHAKRRDGEVFASMAAEVYDAPRTVTLVTPDGKSRKAEIMQMAIDPETGKHVILNDLTNTEFDVYSSIGASFEGRKQQSVERLTALAGMLQPTDPIQRLVILKLTAMLDGVDMDDVKEYAHKQMILSGFKEPETEEEMQLVAAAAGQRNAPSAEMVLAQAELLKGQAAMQREKRESVTAVADIENARAKLQLDGVSVGIDAYNAQTSRQKAQIQGAQAGVSMAVDQINTAAKIAGQRASARDRLRSRPPIFSNVG